LRGFLPAPLRELIEAARGALTARRGLPIECDDARISTSTFKTDPAVGEGPLQCIRPGPRSALPSRLRAHEFSLFCDVRCFSRLSPVWFENALIVSAAAVGILLPQLLWIVDFLGSATGLPAPG